MSSECSRSYWCQSRAKVFLQSDRVLRVRSQVAVGSRHDAMGSRGRIIDKVQFRTAIMGQMTIYRVVIVFLIAVMRMQFPGDGDSSLRERF